MAKYINYKAYITLMFKQLDIQANTLKRDTLEDPVKTLDTIALIEFIEFKIAKAYALQTASINPGMYREYRNKGIGPHYPIEFIRSIYSTV